MAGHQYATLVFVNSSGSACSMSGFPTIALLAGGATIGSTTNSGSGSAVVRLAPGQSASSDLVNNSTCGADNSDSIRIGIPGTTDTVVKPLSFRGCTVSVSAIQAGS